MKFLISILIIASLAGCKDEGVNRKEWMAGEYLCRSAGGAVRVEARLWSDVSDVEAWCRDKTTVKFRFTSDQLKKYGE